jgi:hypothetical protein
VVCWLEPKRVGRAAVGDEAGRRLSIGMGEGPECQVRR